MTNINSATIGSIPQRRIVRMAAQPVTHFSVSDFLARLAASLMPQPVLRPVRISNRQRRSA